MLNDEQYAGASILVAGSNFGTGSSREHAVWAIQDYGFRAVISPRFADIFRNNATKCGLVPVQVEAAVGEALMRAVEADPTLELTIDVERGTVAAPAVGIEAPFEMDENTRHRLVNGLDDIGLSLQHVTEIDGYETTRPAWLPSVRA